MSLTVLIADDDPGIRLSVSRFLESEGYCCLTAGDGAQALEMIHRYQPHLLITDIAMPNMNGYELVRQVRQHPSLRLLPVIYLTARTELEERIRAYRTGGDVYLSKPFDLNELAAVVRNLLDRAQLVQIEWQQRQQPFAAPKTRTLSVDLTQREKEVLGLLVAGLSNAQIGDRLHLSARTIEKHVSSLFQKTAVHNRAELVRLAIEQGLVERQTSSQA
ncbi:response regulator transcription factor [Thermosynechococcus sp. PP45]|uniref:response regulator transcription factor n=1 Tax=unclassified Thermosynechococcus TaxID=2622553 RepID=UPI00122DCAC8|nr:MULTISPECIES: response regulator transcription factor [unclassified Thermosynechococcus]MDR5640224.1 response regulator transcription factor [Thermosynechococcus sp. PP42]MDR7923013.1 response regulator transcription factor [Thermosynechococcus sp. HY213]QEQ02136.1 response regulator transcription factor [Thermosynechococcus sp. CL-1]WKT81133.1 response regulator transcription factor [Thermosynechococcus sp. PP45]WKT83660.1 response regulator transcription factor [Thermosynechococcus sp. HY